MKPLDGKSILIVDDEEGIRIALKKLLLRNGAEVTACARGSEVADELRLNSFDAAVIDVRLQSGESGIALLRQIRVTDAMPVVMITGYGTVSSAVEAMKEGASDFILKPIDNEALIEIIAKNISISVLKQENAYLRQELRAKGYPAGTYITENSTMLGLIAKADRIKSTPATILITGESGTGKEVFAQYLHYTSDFAEGPFIGLNCAALDEHLLLSELFGHEKGAFTGAHERKTGKLELANNGTLFLDEIGDMSLQVQSKLLRVLEERSFERVGGSRTIHADFRLITATNRNLEALIRSRDFREDLFYRIKVVSFDLLPLRERKEDIEPLMRHFITYFSDRYHKKISSINDGFIQALGRHSWPGNVRELRNIVNQAVLLCENGEISNNDFCIEPPAEEGEHHEPESGQDWHKGFDYLSFIESETDRIEKRVLLRALREYKGNKSEIARKLGITRKTLSRKLERFKLDT